jgi:hypothetical protein
MTVRRRHVLFVAGFDPKGASYYHGLYQRESARQAALGAWTYEVGPRRRLASGNDAWQVRTVGKDAQPDVNTTVEHLCWDDLVRREWPQGAWQVLVGSVMAYVHALASGRALLKVGQVAPMTLFSLAWPGLCWLAVVGLAMVLAALAWGGMQAFLSDWGPGAGAARVAGLVAASVAGAVLAGAWRLERRWNTTWLLRIYRFADRWARARMPWLDERLDSMARRLQEVLQDPEVDEVLLVGYSVGSMLSVSMVARALAEPSVKQAPLALLTLGHCVPLLGLMPKAGGFRQELAQVAQAPLVFWVDISSPTDWGSFALADPVALCLEQPGLNPRAMVSPRFHTLCKSARYVKLRRDKRRMHLQYLMSGELPGAYDFFDLTAGPGRLKERVWKK